MALSSFCMPKNWAWTSTIPQRSAVKVGLETRSPAGQPGIGYPSDDLSIKRIFHKYERYAEEFFRTVGAEDVDSFDNSDYERATCIHDMNQVIPNSKDKDPQPFVMAVPLSTFLISRLP